jgi:hypothetical protein
MQHHTKRGALFEEAVNLDAQKGVFGRNKPSCCSFPVGTVAGPDACPMYPSAGTDFHFLQATSQQVNSGAGLSSTAKAKACFV